MGCRLLFRTLALGDASLEIKQTFQIRAQSVRDTPAAFNGGGVFCCFLPAVLVFFLLSSDLMNILHRLSILALLGQSFVSGQAEQTAIQHKETAEAPLSELSEREADAIVRERRKPGSVGRRSAGNGSSTG